MISYSFNSDIEYFTQTLTAINFNIPFLGGKSTLPTCQFICNKYEHNELTTIFKVTDRLPMFTHFCEIFTHAPDIYIIIPINV